MVKSTEAMSARARARKAKAQLDAQRAEHDRVIVDATTEFYEAVEALATARAAAAAAEELRTKSVARLLELGQSEQQIATLCGIGVKEVRDLRRLATATQSKGRSAARSSKPAEAAKDEAASAASDGDAPGAGKQATAAA